MDLKADFASYQQKVLDSLVKVTKTASHLSSQDLGFHRSSSDKVSKSLDQQGRHLLELTSKLLKAAAKDTNKPPPILKNLDSIEDNWPKVVDVVDDQFEKADASLDECTGVIKRMSPAVQDFSQPSSRTPTSTKSYVRFPKVFDKPQVHFNRQVNNFEVKPFKPLLSYKPHAIKSLEESIGDGSNGYNHPYAYETEQYTYPSRLYEPTPPIPFTFPEETSATIVDTEDGMLQMVLELKRAKEIAVDLEHHDYRSYVGIVCLMQISTRDKDWIVDTLKPWREKLQILNEVFADPKIIKVFHGSSMDMIWLQRDLGLYVVGLFDTYYASDALNLPGRSLKYLLQRFVNFEAQKQYQLSDWRLRPLPAELIDYARSDTHYLLNVYDQLRNMLIQHSTTNSKLVDFVLENSKKESLQIYQRFVYNAESGRGSHGWFALFTEHSNDFDSEQFAVFRALHEWRDRKARELDESPVYLINNKSLWNLAQAKPVNQTELHRFCRPVPGFVIDQFAEFKDVVFQAKRDCKDDPTVYEMIKQNEERYGMLRNRWRKPKEAPRPQHDGIGATLNQLRLTGDVVDAQARSNPGAPSPAPIVERAEQSVFWGTVPSPVTPTEIEFTLSVIAMNTILPLPAMANGSTMERIEQTTVDAAPERMEEAIPASPAREARASQGSVPAYITNVNDKIHAKALRELLECYGELKYLDISRSRASLFRDPSPVNANPSQKCAFVEFATFEGYTTAATANPHYINNQMILIKERRPRPDAYAGPSDRKRSASEAMDISDDQPITDSDTSPTQSTNPEMESHKAQKQRRKEEKRASKKVKLHQEGAKAAAIVHFDYAAQPDMLKTPLQALHAPTNMSSSSTLPMNPYAKALDTSTGARQNKMGKELKGKSMTFKS